MVYHIEFADPTGQRFTLEGVKYMQKTPGSTAVRDLLGDYTTLYTHVSAASPMVPIYRVRISRSAPES